MCGISGIAYLNREKKVVPNTLKEMADSITHRGPDDEGYYIQQNIGLAFRRLSIIDLSTGHQPLSNNDDSIQIVFNGEIYNYLEQRELLKRKGYIFKTTTDTEVILHLYEEYGTKCLEFLRGMFAFAIWNNNKQQLFCARDRFGIKPFYYYTDNEKFVFGSEIKAILKAGNINKTLSADGLNSYLAFGYITNDLSIYKEIKKLSPAHYLVLSFKERPVIEINKYWDIHFEPDYSKSEKQWCDEIEATLSEAVKLHMIADVPLGAFLSGGVDSSAVVALMAKNSATAIKTFSIGFKEEKYSELKYAKQIAQQYGCTHHEQIVEPESISLLPKLVNAYDEPFADTSVIPTYYVSKFAREHVTVALSGDGGDELFAGYTTYKNLQKAYKYNRTPYFFNQLVWGSVHKLMPSNIKGKTFTHFLSKNRNYLGAYVSTWPEDERKKLMRRPEFKYNNTPEKFKEEILRNGYKKDFLSNHQYLDMKTYMVDDVLTKVDRASMLNSLEVRVPLLDHKFAELTFKIPSHLKLKGPDQKYIFKQSLKKFLPDSILDRPKSGFGTPLSAWFKEGLKEYVNDTLFTGNPLLSNYLDSNYMKKTLQNRLSKSSYRVWTLLCLEEWLRQNKI